VAGAQAKRREVVHRQLLCLGQGLQGQTANGRNYTEALVKLLLALFEAANSTGHVPAWHPPCRRVRIAILVLRGVEAADEVAKLLVGFKRVAVTLGTVPQCLVGLRANLARRWRGFVVGLR